MMVRLGHPSLTTEGTSVHTSTPTLGRLFSGLNCTNDVGLVMNAMPLSSCFSAHQRLIHLDRPISTDPVSLGMNHASAQLVQQLKSSLVAANAELIGDLCHPGCCCKDVVTLAGVIVAMNLAAVLVFKVCREQPREVENFDDSFIRQRR